MSIQFTQVNVPMTEFKIDVFIGGTKEEHQLIQKNRYGLPDKDLADINQNECCTIRADVNSIVGDNIIFYIILEDLNNTPVLIHELLHLMFQIGKEYGDFRLSNESYKWASPMIEQIARDILNAKYETLTCEGE